MLSSSGVLSACPAVRVQQCVSSSACPPRAMVEKATPVEAQAVDDDAADETARLATLQAQCEARREQLEAAETELAELRTTFPTLLFDCSSMIKCPGSFQ